MQCAGNELVRNAINIIQIQALQNFMMYNIGGNNFEVFQRIKQTLNVLMKKKLALLIQNIMV